MKRFVGLDGIKGLALIAIVLYHCMQQRLPGGFYGVDVFFTVSGFLIAVSLIRSLAKTGSLNLVRYIPKRAVRLYPALFLLIPVIVVSVGLMFVLAELAAAAFVLLIVAIGVTIWLCRNREQRRADGKTNVGWTIFLVVAYLLSISYLAFFILLLVSTFTGESVTVG